MGNSLKHTSWPGKKWEITWNIWEITWKWEITWNKWEITWTWNKWEITSNIRAGRKENRQPDQNLEKRQNQCSGHGGHFNTRKFMATLVLTFHPCLNLSVKKCFSYFRWSCTPLGKKSFLATPEKNLQTPLNAYVLAILQISQWLMTAQSAVSALFQTGHV